MGLCNERSKERSQVFQQRRFLEIHQEDCIVAPGASGMKQMNLTTRLSISWKSFLVVCRAHQNFRISLGSTSVVALHPNYRPLQWKHILITVQLSDVLALSIEFGVNSLIKTLLMIRNNTIPPHCGIMLHKVFISGFNEICSKGGSSHIQLANCVTKFISPSI
jgi:hypothetical protein